MGDVFLDMSEYLKMYTPYVDNFNRAMQTSIALETSNKAFRAFLKEAQAKPECRGLNLHSLLIMPVQRVLRYSLLLKELLAQTTPEHPDFPQLEAANSKLAELAERLNERKRDAEALEKVVNVHCRLTGWSEALVTPGRRYVRGEEITLREHDTMVVVLGYLFTDLLLFVRPRTAQPTSELVFVAAYALVDVSSVELIPLDSQHWIRILVGKQQLAICFQPRRDAASFASALEDVVATCQRGAKAVDDGRRKVAAAKTDQMMSMIEQQYAARRVQGAAVHKTQPDDASPVRRWSQPVAKLSPGERVEAAKKAEASLVELRAEEERQREERRRRASAKVEMAKNAISEHYAHITRSASARPAQ